jgi:hypothetical protein
MEKALIVGKAFNQARCETSRTYMNTFMTHEFKMCQLTGTANLYQLGVLRS